MVLNDTKMLKTRSLEKIVRGFSNHRRIQLLALLAEKPNLSVFEIADELNVNFKTISDHLRRLLNVGLVEKKNKGNMVCNKLTDLGNSILKFLRTLE